MSRRGSVLLEAVLALMIFMVGTAALVTLLNGALRSLTRAELEGRLAGEVAGTPVRAAEAPRGELERADGRLGWERVDGDGDESELRVEFFPEGHDRPLVHWRIPLAGGVW